MQKRDIPQSLTCQQCRNSEPLDFDFSMAFQPIVDTQNERIFGYEALVRGLQGQPARDVISQVTDENVYRFDQDCRVIAIRLAAQLDIRSYVSINFLPNAVYRPEQCIRTTLEAAEVHGFPIERILFEVTEVERVESNEHLSNIVKYYQTKGFKTALDDFGAGYAGLNLLASFQPNIIKLDMELIRDIHLNPIKRTIVSKMVELNDELGITTLAEGVESREEMIALRTLGIHLFQGYYFAKPEFESLPLVDSAVYSI
ncbi:EAL domain-containing protein [Alteromonas oceanisediminis]|uniref:EAL domain-containing protein n=1 Tax=Alteromonas oceanisediminis TaxID=2836180 RepID=UPI001BDA8CCE|nr:EAL domain-containing protein [Alteromonas oceanisediminis]MBT0585242.1 EAL domain-containing protein [Alteromonas oceanisediminis]